MLRVHVYPQLGDRQLAKVTDDDITGLIADIRGAGRSAYTVKNG